MLAEGTKIMPPLQAALLLPQLGVCRRNSAVLKRQRLWRAGWAVAQCRSTLRDVGSQLDVSVIWSFPPGIAAAAGELPSALTSAFEELRDHYRAVIVLHDVDALSMAEVAECLDITMPTAKARAHPARLLLRQRLGEFMSGAPSGL